MGGGSAFRAILTTRGRSTGREHSVRLLAVRHDDRIYFSRHRPDSDWFQNAVADPRVVVRIGGTAIAGRARRVTDESLASTISGLKYPGERRARERRVVIEVTPCV